MRQVGVGRVILNVALFSSMNLQQDDRVVRFLVPELNEEGETSTIIHLVRVNLHSSLIAAHLLIWLSS